MSTSDCTVIGEVIKVDQGLGLVFGWAIQCTKNGQPYYDLNIDRDGVLKGERVPEHISEDEMLKSALDFSENTDRPGNEMHTAKNQGQHVFLFPMTADIAKSFGFAVNDTGLMIGYKPPPDILAKFVSGDLTGFSIEGVHVDSELIDA